MSARFAALSFLIPCLLLIAPHNSPAQGDAKPVKATTKAADGLTIAYDVRGKGDTALVFLHGWCMDRTSWKGQLDKFAGNYKVVAVDLGGHGESGKDRKPWTVTGLAGDVEAVVKALGLKRVILVGHSMGGPVSLAAAKRLPGTVVAVVGVDTLHNAEQKWPEDQAKTVLEAFEKDFKGTLQFGLNGMLPEKVDPEVKKWITAKAEANDPKMAIGLMRDFPKLDYTALFKDAKVPVRCINAGSGFQFYTPTATETNKKYADFNVVIMEGVGHFPMLERPGEFNEKLREILKEFGPKK